MPLLKKCCLCGRIIDGEGYDAKPHKEGRVCQKCYVSIVKPAKMNLWIKGGCK
jgi:ribosome-binding protein aMBF1 (putative translation factor)